MCRIPLALVLTSALLMGARPVSLSAVTQGATPAAAGKPAPAAAPAIQARIDSVRNEVFSEAGKLNEAIKELHAILGVDPGAWEAHLLLGLAYRSLGAPDLLAEAKAEFQQALDIYPDFVPTRLYLAEVYIEFARFREARDQLEAGLALAPRQPQMLGMLADVERRLGNPARAIDLLREALQINPGFVQGQYYLGLTLLDMGRREEGIQQIEQVVAAGVQVPDVFLSLGAAYVEAGRADDAIRTLDKGLAIDQYNMALRLQLARAYRLKGLLDDAEAQLALAMPTGTGAPATAFDQQMEAELYTEQGLIQLQRGRVDEAIAALLKSLEMDATQGEVHRHLASAYIRKGSFTEAAAHAAEAEKLKAPLADDERAALQKGLQGSPGGGGQ
jgi:tetratricopeptide (TPR) repeat protein